MSLLGICGDNRTYRSRTLIYANRELRFRPARRVVAMTESLPMLHHVVFAITIERLDRAAEYLHRAGFSLRGFRARGAWSPDQARLGPRLRTHRRRRTMHRRTRGWQLTSWPATATACSRWSYEPPIAMSSEHIALRYGAKSDFRQHVEGDGFEVNEIKLEPLYGIPLTLLTTNLP